MRKLIILITAMAAITACNSVKEEDNSEVALQTAKAYYDLLLTERYDDFVAGMAGTDSIDSTYHEQMVANTALFVEAQNQFHKGMVSFTPVRAERDSTLQCINALLSVTFADSTRETISVPMIERNGVWYMK